MSPGAVFDLLKQTYSEWRQDKVSRLAAALAYYAMFSLGPLVLIVIAIASQLKRTGPGSPSRREISRSTGPRRWALSLHLEWWPVPSASG